LIVSNIEKRSGVADLVVLMEELSARVEALEAENSALRRRHRPRTARADGGSVTRRNLLRLSGTAAGVAAGAVLLRPQSAGATTAAMQFGAVNDAGASVTELTSSASQQTLLLTNSNGASGTARRWWAIHGQDAQARLVPSASATHPARGTAGDLFVDSSKRLWFCKGASTWRQIA
jgi:hypothetical protein